MQKEKKQEKKRKIKEYWKKNLEKKREAEGKHLRWWW